MKKVLVILSLMMFAYEANAQFGISGGVSGLKFNGDVGKERNANYFGDARLGYNFGVDYRPASDRRAPRERGTEEAARRATAPSRAR